MGVLASRQPEMSRLLRPPGAGSSVRAELSDPGPGAALSAVLLRGCLDAPCQRGFTAFPVVFEVIPLCLDP